MQLHMCSTCRRHSSPQCEDCTGSNWAHDHMQLRGRLQPANGTAALRTSCRDCATASCLWSGHAALQAPQQPSVCGACAQGSCLNLAHSQGRVCDPLQGRILQHVGPTQSSAVLTQSAVIHSSRCSTHLSALRVCLGQSRHPCRGQPKLGSLAQDQRLQLCIQHAHNRGACHLVQPALHVPAGLAGACSNKLAQPICEVCGLA